MTRRLAIACSGLGNIRRGNENWAQTVAEALHAVGEPVTLFGAGELTPKCPYRRLQTLPRESRLWRRWMAWPTRYRMEQYLFSRSLRRALRRQPHDIVESADPQLAWWLREGTRRGGVVTVYQDGLMLGPDWNWRFDWVQVLSPIYRDEAAMQGRDVTRWRAIPQMVDTLRFSPTRDRARVRRAALGEAVPSEALVVLAVGDFSPTSKKRLDWVLREVAATPAPAPDRPVHLVLAGQATEGDLRTLEELGRPLLGDRLHLLSNRPTSEMSALFQSADLFVHAALQEPFGVVFIEAMACGLPVVCHPFPVSRWIVGEGGVSVDMTEPGSLRKAMERWIADPAERKRVGALARRRAEAEFSPGALVPRYRAMLEEIRTIGGSK